MDSSNDVVEEAVSQLRNGCSCSQAIAYSFGIFFGLDEKLLLQVSSGLAGGMAGAGQTCGVISAGILIIGAVVGPRTVTDMESRKKTLELSEKYMECFSSATGSTLCSELNNGTDLRSEESVKALRESGRPEEIVRRGGELLLQLLPTERHP